MPNPYSVTPEKIITCLKGLAAEFASEGRRGDPRPALLRAAADIVERSSAEPASDADVGTKTQDG